MHWTTLPPFPRISRGLIRSGLSAASRLGQRSWLGPLFGCPLDPSLRPKSTNDEIQNGSNRIRTSEGHRQRIYNPPPLTSRASTHVTQLRQRWSRLYVTNLDLTVGDRIYIYWVWSFSPSIWPLLRNRFFSRPLKNMECWIFVRSEVFGVWSVRPADRTPKHQAPKHPGL